MNARDHIDKIGILGATFAALCCLGISAVLSIVCAIGLGFVIHDAVLLPLLIISLFLVLWGPVLRMETKWQMSSWPVLVRMESSSTT